MTEAEVMEEFVKANNSFLSSVYKEIIKEEKANVLMSPLSAQTILALTHYGCRGQSAEQLRLALHLPDDQAKIQSGVKGVLSNLKTKEGCKLCIANKMYVTKKFSIHNEFQEIVREVYFADSENIDFLKSEEAAETMNNWVKKETENKISNLIDSEVLTEFTRIIVINAMYFKGDWEEKFHLCDTKKMKFYKTPNETVEVDAMSNKRLKHFSVCISEELNAKVLKLPIHGNASMMFVLPNEQNGLAELENKIEKVFTPYKFMDKLAYVFIPKFKIEYQINFKAVLQNLGVQDMFSDRDADLSGVSGEKGDLVVDGVLQKTFIDVSEEGVEAAAATYAQYRIPMCGYMGDLVEFKADHPFIFYIMVNDVIIFAGRVTEPRY